MDELNQQLADLQAKQLQTPFMDPAWNDIGSQIYELLMARKALLGR